MLSGSWMRSLAPTHPNLLTVTVTSVAMSSSLPSILARYLFLLAALFTTAFCWEIPLPGGRRIQLDSGGVLRIQLQNQDLLPPLPAKGALPDPSVLKSIRICDTGTKKGYGAFWKGSQDLDQGTFLGVYEGDRFDSREALEASLAQRQLSSMDYALSVDGGATFLDGFQRAQNRSLFSPVHLNHADSIENACNCLRVLGEGRVAFFTSRRIQIGEELCFDYGSNYWRGRENEKLS